MGCLNPLQCNTNRSKISEDLTSTPPAAQRWLAIQQDAAAISVDWQGFTHPDPPAPGQFDGALFVLGPGGEYLTHLPWAQATDDAADQALAEAGWHRAEPGRTDDYDRRVAHIHTTAAMTEAGRTAVDRPAGPTATEPVAGAIAGRDPDQVFASIARSIDKATEYLGQLPSAAYYRTPTTPNSKEPA